MSPAEKESLLEVSVKIPVVEAVIDVDCDPSAPFFLVMAVVAVPRLLVTTFACKCLNVTAMSNSLLYDAASDAFVPRSPCPSP